MEATGSFNFETWKYSPVTLSVPEERYKEEIFERENEDIYEELLRKSLSLAKSKSFRRENRVKRDSGYGHGCKRSGLGIFNFLLFLVVLLGLLNSLLSSAMTMIMINGENVSLLQVL